MAMFSPLGIHQSDSDREWAASKDCRPLALTASDAYPRGIVVNTYHPKQ